MEWPVFQVSHETPEQTIDPSFWDKAKATHNRFKKYRAEVIEASLFVENSLTNILLDFFSYPSTERHALMRGLIFDAEFCTFFQKWKILRQLLDFYGNELGLSQSDVKTLKKELHELISLRNRFAHGTIIVDARDFSVWIAFMEGGKQLEKVSESELSKITDMCDRIHGQLYNMHKIIESLNYKLPKTET
jgi:hypothetical protein